MNFEQDARLIVAHAVPCGVQMKVLSHLKVLPNAWGARPSPMLTIKIRSFYIQKIMFYSLLRQGPQVLTCTVFLTVVSLLQQDL